MLNREIVDLTMEIEHITLDFEDLTMILPLRYELYHAFTVILLGMVYYCVYHLIYI